MVTGASSGIGESFVEHLAGNGHNLVLVARNAGELERVARAAQSHGVEVRVVIADLSTRDGVERAGAASHDVDVLVANAGVTHAAPIGDTDRDQLDSITYLLATGVVRLCEIAVPSMIARGKGDVVIVSSIAAFTPMRKAGPYAAAKSHVTAYARSLALEVRPLGVRVTAVCPGYVRTDLHRRAGLDHLTRQVPRWMWLQPEAVVRSAMRALQREKVVVVPGAVYRLTLPFLSSSWAQRTWSRLTRRRTPRSSLG
jgi:short-subunit dehydrogenase